jgi:hypothetical protein
MNEDAQSDKDQPQKLAKLNKRICKLNFNKSDHSEYYPSTTQLVDENIDLKADDLPDKDVIITGEFSLNFHEKFNRIQEVVLI